MTQPQFGLMSGIARLEQPNIGHRHQDVELNYLESGHVTYLYHGQHLTLSAGNLVVFWAAIPHQIIAAAADTTLHWLTLPLATVLQWRLPDVLTQNILNGQPLLASGNTVADTALFQQWQHDMRLLSAERQGIILLEVQARLRRMALRRDHPRAGDRSNPATSLAHARTLASIITERYADELTIAELAAAVDLNPGYAMTIFRQHYRMTIWEYLTQYRVAQAQRLLVTTAKPLDVVASEAGFTSRSRFYAAFQRSVGQSPKRYRLTMQGNG